MVRKWLGNDSKMAKERIPQKVRRMDGKYFLKMVREAPGGWSEKAKNMFQSPEDE